MRNLCVVSVVTLEFAKQTESATRNKTEHKLAVARDNAYIKGYEECIATFNGSRDIELEKSLLSDTLFSFEGTNPYRRKSGGDSKEDPPVTMPNTEVKLLNVDDTWRATAWESRKLPDSTFGGRTKVV